MENESHFISESKKHVLNQVWNKYPNVMSYENKSIESPSIQRYIAEIFAAGEFYFYVLNIGDSSLSNHHENILKMHGLEKYPQHLKDIIDLIHPEDISFVIEAERMAIEKMMEIGFEHQLNLKSSYCFRMKTGQGNYELFYHQALHTLKDENDRLLQAINIHTNIQHITQENSYTVLISGIGERNDFHQMNYQANKTITSDIHKKLTKRELQILTFLAKGFTGKEISNILNISEHTTRTHRKNLLQKLNARNTSDLVRQAFENAIV